MSNRNEEPLCRWLEDVNDDGIVIGVEDVDEAEEDHLETNDEDRSIEIGEDDILSDLDMETENDPDGIEMFPVASSVGPFVNPEFYLGSDRITKWFLDSRAPQRSMTPMQNDLIPLVRPLPVPQSNAKNANTPITAFQSIITDDITQKIAEYTNIYINKIRTNFARERDARPTDSREIRAFIGILYMAGALKAGRKTLLDMWDNTMGTGVESVYLTMSVSRFRFLLRCLRFDNIHTRDHRQSLDKLAAFREIFYIFVANCKDSYEPSDELTIDEQLVAFRGNCSFRVNMPSKPAKHGLKVFALVSTSNLYTSNLEVYVGKQPEGPFSVSNDPEDLVLRLVEPISGSNRNITLDHWFASVPLSIRLHEEKRLTMIAILRKNKREVPPNFLPGPSRAKNSSLFGFQKNCTLVSYVPQKRKVVLAISTKHCNGEIDPESGEEMTPVIITTYNNAKNNVEILDKMYRQYYTAINSRRWSLSLFFHILNVGGVNAFIIYRKNVEQGINRMEFLKTLAFELMKPQIEHRITLEMVPREIITRGRLLLKLEIEESARQQPQPIRQGTSTHGRCYVCGRARSKSTRKKCVKCYKWVCNDHLRCVCERCMQ